MKISSWNVNGIRACAKKGTFHEYLTSYEPDILFLQETKAMKEQLPDEVLQPYMYHTEWVSAEKKGYSGVALLTKLKPISIITELGIPEFDSEARVIGAEFEDKVIFGVYFPNSQRPGRLDYKFKFYEAFFNLCEDYRSQGKHIIVCGDFNTAHKEIDLARPKENVGNAGFLPEERAGIDKLIDKMGYVDTLRQFNSSPGQYSWWTYRSAARKRNVGWRIDYVLVNKEFSPQLKKAFIHNDVLGSDHCPVGIEI
jgi:exodeoxyribonuclease III